MYIAEVSHPEYEFFVKEEDPDELRTALLHSAVGHLALVDDDYFPEIKHTLENRAVFPEGDRGREYHCNVDPLLLLQTSAFKENLRALVESIDTAAAQGTINAAQWYDRRKEACEALEIPITWITKNGDASTEASMDRGRIKLAPEPWEWRNHGNYEDDEAEQAELTKIIGQGVTIMALRNVKVEASGNYNHRIIERGTTVGRLEGGSFKPIVTTLDEPREDSSSYSHSLQIPAKEILVRDGDTIVCAST